MALIIGRSGWHALPPNWPIPYADRVDTFVVHHPVTEQPEDLDHAISIVQRLQRQHLAAVNDKGKLVYGDLAYNVCAGPDCVIIGRGQTVTDGSTDKDESTLTWGVCVLGDYRTDLVTPAIRRGLLAALTIGVEAYGRHPVRPHSDFYPTECCGSNLRDQLPAIEAELYGGDDVTPQDIDALAAAIVDKFFSRPIELHNPQEPVPNQTTIHGWFTFVHDEITLIRLKP